jgi:hypothetical protein
MKNLIILLLVIGAAVSQIVLTTSTAASKALPIWTLTYVTTTSLQYYSFTLSYNAGTASTTFVDASTESSGVVCIFTTSAFALTAGAATTLPSISMSVIGNGAAGSALAVTSVAANWNALVLTYHPALTYASATTVATGAGGLACAIVGGATPVIASFVATYTFSLVAGCGPLPQMGSVNYMRCSGVSQGALLATAGGVTATIIADKNVTVAATTTTCATTTGASTFATGATILAGIAYLQF